MVMIVSSEQILTESDFPNSGLICETHSRNRWVRMVVNSREITVLNQLDIVGIFSVDSLPDAVETFNHFASRDLRPILSPVQNC